MSVLGPVKLEDGAGKKSQEKVEKIQLHMVHAQLMATIEADHFCCSKQDVAEKKYFRSRLLLLLLHKSVKNYQPRIHCVQRFYHCTLLLFF